ncbi:MAG TPA: hypothetical protein VFW37_10400 [Alphaproteobacteria bacterium]|nr:hypothetical protein [Alphaproteobacteria bacterium]
MPDLSMLVCDNVSSTPNEADWSAMGSALPATASNPEDGSAWVAIVRRLVSGSLERISELALPVSASFPNSEKLMAEPDLEGCAGLRSLAASGISGEMIFWAAGF